MESVKPRREYVIIHVQQNSNVAVIYIVVMYILQTVACCFEY